jgi:OmpA-OmpF porin, OOP family
MPIRFFIALIVAVCAAHALAQTIATPSADQMIEQLRSPRTRSLRNLQVEAVPAASASSSASTPATPQASAVTHANATAAARPQLSLLIQFDFDSARVRPESMQALNNLAAALQSDDLRSSRFAVEGHTDGKGRADYNLRLSQLRADAVSSYLASLGIAQQRLQAIGKGAGELANRSDPAASENRRVRIVNLD